MDGCSNELLQRQYPSSPASTASTTGASTSSSRSGAIGCVKTTRKTPRPHRRCSVDTPLVRNLVNVCCRALKYLRRALLQHSEPPYSSGHRECAHNYINGDNNYGTTTPMEQPPQGGEPQHIIRQGIEQAQHNGTDIYDRTEAKDGGVFMFDTRW